MKFRNKLTGQIIEPNSKFLIEDFKKKTDKYEEVKEKVDNTKNNKGIID